MTSRETKRNREKQLNDSAYYMRKVGAILSALLPTLQKSYPDLSRTSHLGPFDGAPDRFSIWFVFQKAPAQKEHRTQAVNQLGKEVVLTLQKENYPMEALSSFEFLSTSEEEIKEAGGDFAFFR